MASSYPGGLDAFPTTRVDGTTTATTHPLDHNDANDALNKIEAELGILPKGASATVAARLTAIEGASTLVEVRNVSGSLIPKGSVVNVTGSSGQIPTVTLCRADADATMPAVGLMAADLANNTTATVLLVIGLISNINTSAFSDGERLFVSSTVAGGLTATQPDIPNYRQRVAFVANSHATQGKLLVIIGAQFGDLRGTRQNTFVIGDQLTGQKQLMGRRASADHLLRFPDSATARTLDLPDKTGILAVEEGGTNYHDLTVRATEPPTPGADALRLYARYIGGRALLKVKGPSGLDVPLQPAFFQNTIRLMTPNTTTTMGLIGGTATNVGTLSHPTPTISSFGYCTNCATAATINTAGGVSDALAYFHRGAGGVGEASGFFMAVRFWFPAAGDLLLSGFVAGVTNGTLAASTSSATLANHSAMLQQHDGAGDFRATNFGFIVKNTGTQVQVDTGIAIAINKLYDFFMFSPPYAGAAPALSMRLDNITDATTFSHTFPNTEAQLPGSTTLLRSAVGVLTTEALAKNVRIKKLYVETDL